MQLRYVENPVLKAAEVARLRVAVGWDAREKQLEKVIDKTYLTAACFDNDNLVGFVDVISDGVDDAFIRNLVVLPGYQRFGIALELLNIIIRRTKADRIKTVNVLFEPELIDLYRKAGFRIVNGGMIDHENEGF